jgi:TP901 family phage tail tape measure protein
MAAGFKLLAGGYIAAASGIAAMGGALKLAQKSADFKLQIDQLKVVADQSGIATSRLKGLEKTVQEVANVTTFSVTDITKASKTFLQRGLVDVGISKRGLEGAAIFSEISLGQIDIVKSSEIASQAIKAFRNEGESDFEAMERTLGVMANVANTTSLTFDKLPLTMGRIARAGSISGLALAELSVAVGKATDTMGSYRIAGTSVAVLLEQLSKGGKEKQLLRMFGLQGTRIKDVGLTKLIDAISSSMKATGTAAEDMAKQIADKLEIGAKNVQILTGAAKAAAKETFGSFVAEAEKAGNKGIEFLKNIVEKKYYDTLGGQLKLLEGKFENFQINLGTTFAPALESVTRLLAGKGGILDSLNNFLTDATNQKSLKEAAESFLKGAFISALTGMTALLTGAVMLLGPIIAPMLPMMIAVGGAVTVLTNNLAESFGGFKNLGMAIGDAAKVLLTGDNSFLGPETEDRFQNANRIVESLTSSFDFLKGVFEGIMTVLRPLVSLVESLVGGLKSLAGVFGGEGAGGAGQLLGQVLMGGMLFKGARGLLGGGAAAAAMGGGVAGGAAGRAASAAAVKRATRVRGIKGARARLNAAFSGTIMGSGRAAAVATAPGMSTNALMTGGSGLLFAPGTSIADANRAARNEPARRRALRRRRAEVRLGGLRGARAGARMAGGAGIAGAIGGAALGQMIAPDDPLVQLGAMMAVQAGAQAAAPKLGALAGRGAARLGLSLGGTALGAAGGLGASVGSIMSGISAAGASGGIGAGALAASGPLAIITATGLAAAALGHFADETFGWSDKISDALAGIDRDKITSKRGLVGAGLKNVDLFREGGGLDVSEKSKKAFFDRLGKPAQLAFAQREQALTSSRTALDAIFEKELARQVLNAKLGEEDVQKIGRAGFKKRAQEALAKGEGAFASDFKQALEKFSTNEALFKQMMEKNQLLTNAQQEMTDAVNRQTAAGVDAARATKIAADNISNANFAVYLDGKVVGNAMRDNMVQLGVEDAVQGEPERQAAVGEGSQQVRVSGGTSK